MGILLSLQVYLMRLVQRLASLADAYSALRPPRSKFRISISTQSGTTPGRIPLYFYGPSGYHRSCSTVTTTPKKQGYPLILNFHGGGFTIGHAEDDARWVAALLNEIDVVVVSVGYRKAPKHPQPTAVEDGVNAMRWVWAHAAELGIDPQRTIITGFSAGGNLSLTVPMRHYLEQSTMTAAGVGVGHVAGIVAFYPSVDQSLTRDEKKQSNPISIVQGSIPPWLYRMFDEAYYPNMEPRARTSLDLSPALAPRDVLQEGLPNKLAIYTCEWDMLLVEAEEFRKNLNALGKFVGGYMIEKKAHGFDKIGQKDSLAREAMYSHAIQQIKSMV